MLEKILLETLSKIQAVMKYSQIQTQTIPKAVEDGIKFNALRFCLQTYLKTVIKGEVDEDIPKELVEQNKTFIEDIIDVVDIIYEDGIVVTMKYKYKNTSYLRKSGFELDMNKADIEIGLYSHLKYLQNYTILEQLVISFETFVSSVFRLLVTKYPDHYLKDQSIPCSQFLKLNYDSLKQYLIENEVTNIMYAGFPDWVKKLEKHKLDFSFMKSYLNEYYEISCRRNLIVHNDGIVNWIYNANIENSKMQIGEKIYVKQEYIDRSYFVIQTIIYGIIIESIKIDSESACKIIESIIDNAFEHLKNGEWEISIFIYERLKCNRYISEVDNAVVTINLWIAKKNMLGLDKVRKDIEEKDLSALKDRYQMAQLMLLENYENAEAYLEELFPKTITPDSIETWPLFNQYRSTEHYQAFRKKHQDQFDIITATENP